MNRDKQYVFIYKIANSMPDNANIESNIELCNSLIPILIMSMKTN